MLGLVLRALRWRAGLSITVWVCAVVVCSGAALGPVFALAAAESGLQDVLRDAGAETGDRLLGQSGGSAQVTEAEAEQRLDTMDRLPAVAHRPDRLGSLYALGDGAAAGGVMHTSMVWRAGACAQVRLNAGRCPTAPDEAMISARAPGCCSSTAVASTPPDRRPVRHAEGRRRGWPRRVGYTRQAAVARHRSFLDSSIGRAAGC